MRKEIEKIEEIRNISKEQLLQKIKMAKNDISMIGTIAFDLPWKDLRPVIEEKFQEDNFTLHILRESETTIAQYALLNMSQEEESEYGNLSRGNLLGIKDRVVRELKEYLMGQNNGNNIEPPEDKYAFELGELYYKEKRKYILQSYQIHNCEAPFKNYIENCVRKNVLETKKEFFGNKYFINKISDTDTFEKDPDLVPRFSKTIDNILNQKIIRIASLLGDVEKLMDLNDIIDKTEDLYIQTNKKGEVFIVLQIIVDAENLKIEQKVEFPIDQWIDDFKIESEINDINYRLEADKSQAVKRATEVKQEKLEEYKKSPKSRQRLFIKNCYLPIPVPMIKVDNELFITMALTQFNEIQKFQYTGIIMFDKVSGKYQPERGKSGYMSLWQEEFVKYFVEYFINENGAQKYSTEETQKGNRKEVIDIFDENRNRIGIGPRDAFLSNMAIVKSVVWALIFDRKGRILIHQRAKNAKDNQGLWDKSVGGHVSTEDLDTIEAIKREVAEELFTFEHDGQGGHDIVEWMITNKNKIIYLGDWKTARFPDLSALHLSPDEYYNFSLNYPDINKRDFRREIVVTERILPNGNAVKAKCFVDAYLCIVSEDFDISNLKNSKYALLTPNELKRCVVRRSIKLNENREYDAEFGLEEEFKPTSDLAYLVESAIWDDIVTEFAKRVRETFSGDNNE